jgi:hypothetical protein
VWRGGTAFAFGLGWGASPAIAAGPDRRACCAGPSRGTNRSAARGHAPFHPGKHEPGAALPPAARSVSETRTVLLRQAHHLLHLLVVHPDLLAKVLDDCSVIWGEGGRGGGGQQDGLGAGRLKEGARAGRGVARVGRAPMGPGRARAAQARAPLSACSVAGPRAGRARGSGRARRPAAAPARHVPRARRARAPSHSASAARWPCRAAC